MKFEHFTSSMCVNALESGHTSLVYSMHLDYLFFICSECRITDFVGEATSQEISQKLWEKTFPLAGIKMEAIEDADWAQKKEVPDEQGDRTQEAKE